MKLFKARFYSLLLLLVITTFITTSLQGQFYSLGNNPGRLKWRYIEGNHFKVIYPQGIDSLAFRYIWLLDNLKEPVLKSLNISAAPMDVVLHPYSVVSNGMVGWAPSRIELLTTPPANEHYVHNWEKHLIIHELRHVGQFSKFKKGIFKLGDWIIGEQAAVIGMGLYMSMWNLEGDAIISETELTSGGRGRDPDHLIYYKAAFLEGDYRNWNHWRMGSYKEYVPSEYSFGYLYNSFVRHNSKNSNFQGEVMDYTISRFYDINGLSKGLKKYTSLSKNENYNQMKLFYTQLWQKEDSIRGPFHSGDTIHLDKNRNEEYRSYLHPLKHKESLYSLKKDLNKITRLVKIDSLGKEHFVRYMGRVSSPLKLLGSRIFWTEYITTPRWELESYSDLFYYDIESSRNYRVTNGERLFNPSFSIEGDRVAAISYEIEGNSTIKLFDSYTFDKIGEYSQPSNYRLKEVAFVPGGLVALAVADGGAAFFYKSLLASTPWTLIKESHGKMVSDISFDSSSQKLLFLSDINGVRELFAMDLEDKNISMVYPARFGLSGYYKSKVSDTLFVSSFSKRGYSIERGNYALESLKEVTFENSYSYSLAEEFSAQAALNSDTMRVSENHDYLSKPYPKGANLFRFHSWAPLYYNIDNIKNLTYESVYDLVAPGFILYSQNSLSTAYTMLGYSWNEGFHAAHLKFRYTGLYPVIELESHLGNRNKERVSLNYNNPMPYVRDTLHGSPYLNSIVRLYIPLTKNVGGWSSGIVPKLYWRYTNDSFYSLGKGRFSNYQYGSIAISLYRVLNMAHRDIFPRRGGGVTLSFSTVPFSKKSFSSLLYGSAYLYIPGVATNHGMRLSTAFQKHLNNSNEYLISNAISFPRGYSDRYSQWAYSIGAEYGMPLYTGDISLSSILYIKRIQFIPFFNYTLNRGFLGRESLWSTGGDLLFDSNLLGISYPIVLGVRGGITGESTLFMELLFKVPL